jgi:hypothetical protein
MASLTMFLIIANTILMASEFYGMPNAMAVAYEIVNYVITSYFALEMAVKLVGLTPRGYVADKFNIFDGVVVIVSVVELIITSTTGDGGGMLSALRTGPIITRLQAGAVVAAAAEHHHHHPGHDSLDVFARGDAPAVHLHLRLARDAALRVPIHLLRLVRRRQRGAAVPTRRGRLPYARGLLRAVSRGDGGFLGDVRRRHRRGGIV